MDMLLEVLRNILDGFLGSLGEELFGWSKKAITRRGAHAHARTPDQPEAQAHPEPQPHPAPHGWTLHVMQGETVRRSIPLSQQALVIGRDPEANLVLHDQRASKQHAEVFMQDGQPWIRDHESLNGTFVNEQRIHEQALHPGDRVRVGQTVMVLAKE